MCLLKVGMQGTTLIKTSSWSGQVELGLRQPGSLQFHPLKRKKKKINKIINQFGFGKTLCVGIAHATCWKGDTEYIQTIVHEDKPGFAFPSVNINVKSHRC